MDAFDNLFDDALFLADSAIIDTMGTAIYLQINGSWGNEPVRAVFDDPDTVAALPGGAALADIVDPTLFVKTALITGLKKYDRVRIGQQMYWVLHVGEDDTGSTAVRLARGEPGKPATAPLGWSKK
ncbi:head-tail joining protein [Cedecea davisae]|uniref:head-tail joining protein n=1 Tax=Cedecea davisae TaxID=158484 RepID=UPI001D09FC75|nr:head-tail joining protein [Cedecea davisae]